MKEISLYNEIIGKLNLYDASFSKMIRIIEDSRMFRTEFKNPVDFVRNAIYSLKDLGKEKHFDIFGDDSYLKYIYVSYLEAALEEISNCLNNMVAYINSGFIERIKHRKLIDDSLTIFNYDYQLLKIFDPNYVLAYYSLMLQTEGYFEYFKPGMFYKFTVLILDDIKEFGLNAEDNENYVFIMNFIRNKEIALNNNLDGIDYSTYDEKLKMISEKYHTDFISLDRDYSVQVDELSDEEIEEYSRQRK